MADISACFVVNAVGETSVPADIAVGIGSHTDVTVDIVAWWHADPFHGDDRVGVINLDAPDTTLGVDRATYAQALDIISKYDVVQAHHCHSGSIAKLIAAKAGVPCVSREGNMREGFTRLGRVSNGLTNPLADRIVCNSSAVYDSFMKWERALIRDQNIELIPNGVDLERLDAASERGLQIDRTTDSVLIGTAGMLTEQKDHRTLIQAFIRANDRTEIDLELAIAGDGDKRSELESLSRKYGIESHIHFLGLLDRDDVYSLLRELDIYAMPSKWEGFSAAALEAVASKTPCVFSDIPPFFEPYQGVAKFHEVGNSGQLADRIIELAASPEKRTKLGNAGRALVEKKYRMQDIALAYADLYRQIID